MRRRAKLAGFAALLFAVAHCGNETVVVIASDVATAEAGPNEPEDAAIWVHPSRPERSLVLAGHAGRDGGVSVHDLKGERLQFLELGEGLRNLDLRANVSLGGRVRHLAAAAQVGHRVNRVLFFEIDEQARALRPLPDLDVSIAVSNLSGLCLGYDAENRRLFLFVIDQGDEGRIEHWELHEQENGKLGGTLRRSFWIGGRSESCVVDDERGRLFVAEKGSSIWRYDANPSAVLDRALVDRVGGPSGLMADIEGLALYPLSAGEGYLVAASEGNDRFVVYDRGDSHDAVASFQVRARDDEAIVHGSEGLAASSANLGPDFPEGLLAIHDDDGEPEDHLKLVSWAKLRNALELDSPQP